jgi:elongation factor G
MKEYTAEQVRNIALVGHSGAGKTSLAEAGMFVSKAITRMGKTEEGNTVSDFDAEEIRRGISVHMSLVPVEWSGVKLNLLDTPGYADFNGEVVSALHAVEAAVVVVDSVAGVEVGTEISWGLLDELDMPRIVVINKMNRENANWKKVLGELQSSFDARFVPLQVPVGSAHEFKGVYDLVAGSASLGADGKVGDVPDEVMAEVEGLREAVVEAAAESDDSLMEKYFEAEKLTDDEVRQGVMAGAKSNGFVPVLFAAATEAEGVHSLLDTLKSLVPSPDEVAPREAVRAGTEEAVELNADQAGPLAVRVFKTQSDPYVGKLQYCRVLSGVFEADSRVYNAERGEEERVGPVYVLCGKEQTTMGRILPGDIGAVAKLAHTHTGDVLCDKATPLIMKPFNYPQPLFAVAVRPASQADGAKLGPALHKLVEEDPTLHSHYEDATREMILAGMGDAHIDVAVHHLDEKYGVGVDTSIPRVPFRETVTRSATAQYRHKKQTGGAGQFAEVHLRVEPLERGAGFEYASEVFGGAISSSFIPSIEKGIRAMLGDGVFANCPVVDTKAIVYDGKEHPVDSKDIAFQIAGREAFKAAVMDAGPVLLEPVQNVRVIVPASQMGDVLGDLNTRRGMVQGTEQIGNKAVVSAQVPLAEMQRYSTDLRSMTQGRGYFTSEFSHFAQVPHQIAEAIIAAAHEDEEEQ